MITINVRTNTTRKSTVVDATTTPRQVFEDAGVDTSRSMVNLDGAPLTAADFAKTFEELGVADGASANLSAIVKADGAAV